MASELATYRKLPGKKKHFLVGVHRLWLGKDHLLQVHARMGIEDYQRFYLSDIQAITIRKTVAGRIYNGMLAAISLLLGMVAAALDGGAAAFFVGAAGFFLVALVLNWAMGPTCRTCLRTAVQEETLHSLHRLRTAQRVSDRLHVLIEAKQGVLSPAQIAQGQPVALRPPPAYPAYNAAALSVTDAAGRFRIAMLVAFLLLARAMAGIGRFYVTNIGMTLLDIGLFLVLAIAAVALLVRLYEGVRPPAMLAAAWAAVGYVGLTVIGGYVMMMGLAFRHPAAMASQWAVIRQMASLSPRENPWLMGFQLVFIVLALILGVAVWLAARQTRPPRRSPRGRI